MRIFIIKVVIEYVSVFVSLYPFQSDIVDEALDLADDYRLDGRNSIAVLDESQDGEYASRHFTHVFWENEFSEDSPRGIKQLLQHCEYSILDEEGIDDVPSKFDQISEDDQYVQVYGREQDLEEYQGYFK
ncbi:MAG: hypothetical protein ABEK16_00480 [Candidatus Nanohalobium sp.]